MDLASKRSKAHTSNRRGRPGAWAASAFENALRSDDTILNDAVGDDTLGDNAGGAYNAWGLRRYACGLRRYAWSLRRYAWSLRRYAWSLRRYAWGLRRCDAGSHTKRRGDLLKRLYLLFCEVYLG